MSSDKLLFEDLRGKVIIEIKAVSRLLAIYEAQLIHYLKATGIQVGLLVNFRDNIKFKKTYSSPLSSVAK